VLAVLVGALSLFAAVPATADVLVSNIGQPERTAGSILPGFGAGQGFTTGSHTEGYDLTSIEVHMTADSSVIAAQIAALRAEVWSDSSGTPDSHVASLTVPSSITSGAVTFAAPSGTKLTASTTYHIVLSSDTYTGEGGNIQATHTGSNDESGATGWSISNARSSASQFGTSMVSWQTLRTQKLRIRVNGSAAESTDPPRAPTGLSVTPGNAKLDLTWTAVSGVTGYDVHYTSSTSVADDAAVGSTVGTEWVDASHTGTTVSDEITGLTNTTPYRVRVRAVNANGSSDWVHGSGTPAAVTGPSVPQNVVATPGDGKLTLTWQAPSSWGTYAAQGYQFEWKLNSQSAGSWSSVDAHGQSTMSAATSFEFRGAQTDGGSVSRTVSNGTAYDLRIRAVSFDSTANVALQSAWVEASNKVPFVPATVTISATPNPVTEGSDTSVTVRLSSPAPSYVEIPVTTTRIDSEPNDHQTITIVSFSTGIQTSTVTIETNHDADADDETFTVALGTLPSGYVAGSPSSVRIRITDDEGVPEVTLSASPNPVDEGDTSLLKVSLKRGDMAYWPPGSVHIPVIVQRGMLERGDIHSLFTGTGAQKKETIPISIHGAHQRSFGTYEIKTVRDMDDEDETFTVELGTLPSGYVAGTPSSLTVTITDDGILRAPRNPRSPTDDDTPAGSPGVSAPPTDDDPPTGEPSDTDPPPCGESDREYLERFYEASGGDNWHENENWNSEESLGEWYGVETDEDGNVVSLRLPDNNLSGDMPAEELLCLTELVELALWGNDDLSGEVPEELVLAVERAALREIAEMLDINPGWFEENYEYPYDFEDWYEGVTTDDEGRVTELDLPGEIPETLISQFHKRRMITTSSSGGGCALSPEDDSSAFSLFLLTLVVFAVLGRRRER